MTDEQQIENKYRDHIKISKNLEAGKQHSSSIYPIPHPKRPTLSHNPWRGMGAVFEALAAPICFVFVAHLEKGTAVVCFLLWSHSLIAMLCATSWQTIGTSGFGEIASPCSKICPGIWKKAECGWMWMGLEGPSAHSFLLRRYRNPEHISAKNTL